MTLERELSFNARASKIHKSFADIDDALSKKTEAKEKIS